MYCIEIAKARHRGDGTIRGGQFPASSPGATIIHFHVLLIRRIRRQMAAQSEKMDEDVPC